MNWVGGARSRIKLQNERRVQKDYFDRKRLVSKVKHARPPPPGSSKSKKYISQDLLFLRAVSNAHTTARQASAEVEAAPLNVQRVDLSGARRFDRPDRGLELPMSPIGEPSSLELLDASASGLSFYAEAEQPKVSTQKIPHRTILNSFGPGVKDREAKHEQQQPIVSHSSGDSLSPLNMTEYLVPALKKQQPQQFKQQLYRVPQKVPATCYDDASVDSWPGTSGAAGFGAKGRSEIGAAKRRREANLDRETPFNFEIQAVKKPRLQKLPPKSKGSLLEFHNEERETRSGRTKLQTATKPVHGYERMLGLEAEERKPVESMTAGVPLEGSAEPAVSDSAKEFTFPWTSVTATSRSSSTSSLLDEDPLSHMKKPHCPPPQANHARTSQPSHQSTSTFFDESIIGPLSKREMKKQFHCPPPQTNHAKTSQPSHRSTSTLFDESIIGPLSKREMKKEFCSPKTNGTEASYPPQSVSTLFDESIFGALSKMREQLTLPLQEEHAETNHPAPRSVSTVFDESIFGPLLRKELNTAEHSGHTTVHNLDPMLQSRKDSGKPQSMFEQMMLSFEEDGSRTNEAPEVELKTEDTSARHMEWRNFISGGDLSGEVQLETAELLDSRPVVNMSDDPHGATNSQLSNEADGSMMCAQKQSCQRTRGEDKRGLFRVGQKNISVLEGLLCLDEEITSSLESEVLASQDIALSPGELSTEDPIRRVPDVDTQSSEESFSSELEIRENLTEEETNECQDHEIVQKLPVDNIDKNDDCKNGGMVRPCCVDKMHCSAQTEPVPVKVYQEVSCECDIWPAETVQQCRCCKQADCNPVSTSTISPTLVNHETQTVTATVTEEEAGRSVSTQTDKAMLTLDGAARSNCVQMESIGVQYDNGGYLKDQNTQTDIENNVKWLQVDANGCINSESLCSKLDLSTCITADATIATQTSHCAIINNLQAQIRHLKEELGMAESTVIWQSIMMMLYQM